MNRRQAFQASRDPPPHHPGNGNGGGGSGTLLFIFFPLALFFYVWNTVQEEPQMLDPKDAMIKVGGDAWDMENQTYTWGKEEEDETSLWSMDDNNNNDEEEEAQLKEDMDDKIPITGLWILVESWQPGMSNWKQALAEIFVVAKTLQAVLVEPGISNAELVPCHPLDSSSIPVVLPLSHVYNRTRMLQFYPPLASCTKYDFAMNQLTAPYILNVCFHPDPNECEDGETYYQQRINDILDEAMEYAQSHPHNMVLVRFQHVWKSSLDALTLPSSRPSDDNYKNNKKQQPTQQQPQPSKRTRPILDQAMVKTFQTQHLHFASQHYQYLQSHLQAKGIPPASYAVIHWKPTTDTMDSTSTTTTTTTATTNCVETILQVRLAMNLSMTTPFFLITTIPHVDDDNDDDNDYDDDTMMDTTGNEQNNQGLALLYGEHQFLKLETILPSLQEQDAMIGIIMNLILAEQALSFTTCATTTTTTTTQQPQNQPTKKSKKRQSPNSCHSQFPFCETCHAGGGIFGEWALALRPKDNPNTFPCWPQTSSELLAINSLWNKG